LPIGIAKSMTGEYTFAIFAVTVLSLVLSWWVSVYFVPYLGTLLLKPKPHAQAHSGGASQSGSEDGQEHFDTPFYRLFRATLNACLRHRWWTIGATLALFLLGLAGMGQVQQQFFPDSARPEVLVDAWFPEARHLPPTKP